MCLVYMATDIIDFMAFLFHFLFTVYLLLLNKPFPFLFLLPSLALILFAST